MNKERRKELNKAVNALNDVISIIEDVKYDEEYAYNNLPESFQESYRGEQMEENIDEMDEAIEGIKEVISLLDAIIYK